MLRKSPPISGQTTGNRQQEMPWAPPAGAESVGSWTELGPGDRIIISSPWIPGLTGEVDVVTEDGSILWVHLEDGRGRILIHTTDPHRIWRAPADESSPLPED